MEPNRIVDLIRAFVGTDPANAVPEIAGLTIFEEPLVAFAAADDPLYAALGRIDVIGPHHLMPGEWLAGAESVIVWFLPFTAAIVESNRPEGPPSAEWYLAYHWGEAFNNALRDHVAAEIGRAGGAAVAPMRDARFLMQPGTSNWSERHTAYIAGMGSFGLSYSFITEKGCAGRFGSVVTDLDIAPSPRTDGLLRANCLAEINGGCESCISRCPVGAITTEKKDHAACLKFLREEVVPLYQERYGGIRSLCCGKCQTAVPCARTNPMKKKEK
jgi:epoxyqueuosine reductase